LAAFSGDSQQMVTTAIEGKARLFAVPTGQLLASFSHPASVRNAAFSPDGQTLATTSSDSHLRLWHLATGREMAAIEQPGMFRRPILFSPDGGLLALGAGYDGGPSHRIDRFPHAERSWEAAKVLGAPAAVWLLRAPPDLPAGEEATE
jgi:WD40 repeat protein